MLSDLSVSRSLFPHEGGDKATACGSCVQCPRGIKFKVHALSPLLSRSLLLPLHSPLVLSSLSSQSGLPKSESNDCCPCFSHHFPGPQGAAHTAAPVRFHHGCSWALWSPATCALLSRTQLLTFQFVLQPFPTCDLWLTPNLLHIKFSHLLSCPLVPDSSPAGAAGSPQPMKIGNDSCMA